jgi:hypothetical protein
MQDGGKQRYFIRSGQWTVRLAARRPSWRADGAQVTPKDLVKQAELALWLLCQFGGSGAKARHGFGALTAEDRSGGLADLRVSHSTTEALIEDCRTAVDRARAFAEKVLGANAILARPVAEPDSASLPWLLENNRWQNLIAEYELRGGSPWVWMDQIGNAKQEIAKRKAHNSSKVALGLPRNIQCKPPLQPLLAPDGTGAITRHASPLHTRPFVRDGKHWVRMIAFPAKALGGFLENQRFLEGTIEDLKDALSRTKMAKRPDAAEPVTTSTPQRQPNLGNRTQQGGTALNPARKDLPQPRSGDSGLAECELLAEKTKKGGWKFKVIETGRIGPIVNSAVVPADKSPGDVVKLKVDSTATGEVRGTWPMETKKSAKP